MTMDEESAVNTFLAQMRNVTVSLVRNAKSFPVNSSLGSGVLIPAGHDFLLLTAGHLFKKPGPWTLETSTVHHGMSLHIAIRDLQRLAQIDVASGEFQTVDLAWATIALDDVLSAIRDSGGEIASVSLPSYKGPLDTEPLAGQSYGYAASNRAMLDANLNVLVREASYEVYMSVRSRDTQTAVVTFDLARPHQGHSYYEGASGAPIADSEGRIVALLIGGDTDTNTLKGIELSRYKHLFTLAA